MPVRQPLGRMLVEEGRHEGAERLVAAWLRQRFGDDPQIERLAARLAELPEEDSIAKISAATSLNDLAEPPPLDPCEADDFGDPNPDTSGSTRSRRPL